MTYIERFNTAGYLDHFDVVFGGGTVTPDGLLLDQNSSDPVWGGPGFGDGAITLRYQDAPASDDRLTIGFALDWFHFVTFENTLIWVQLSDGMPHSRGSRIVPPLIEQSRVAGFGPNKQPGPDYPTPNGIDCSWVYEVDDVTADLSVDNEADRDNTVVYPPDGGTVAQKTPPQVYITLDRDGAQTVGGFWLTEPPESGGVPELGSLSVARNPDTGPRKPIYIDIQGAADYLFTLNYFRAPGGLVPALWAPPWPYEDPTIAATLGDRGVMRF